MDTPRHSHDAVVSGSVPVPDKLPQKFDRSTLSDKALRSGAIESLISHNEDLMSRLQVALRRISSLEERLQQSATFENKFKFHYKNLKDQVLVLKQREKYLRERKSIAETKFDGLQQRIRILEIEYAKLYTSSQDEHKQLTGSIKKLSKRIRHLNKFKSKLSFVAHKLRKSFKKSQEELLKSKEELKALKGKLGQAVNYIQNQAEKFKKEKYELTEELTILRKKNQNFNEVYNENIVLQNKLVFIQRKHDESRNNFNSEVSKLQEGLAHYREQAKSQILSLRQQNEEVEEKKVEVDALKEEIFTLKDQLESIQCLWRDNQNQLEKQRQKGDSLEALNQQMSRQLSQYRQEFKELHQSFQNERHETAKKMNEVKDQLQTARITDKKTISNNLSQKEKTLPLLISPTIEKLEELITDLETRSL